MKAHLTAAALVATMAIALPSTAAAAPGDFDTSWDGDGIRSDNGYSGDAVAVQSDGKVVVGSRFVAAIRRYNENGTPDTSFGGGDGIVDTNEDVRDVAIQSDGKIVAVGSSGGDFWIARFTATGDPDNSFDTDGEATVDIGTNTDDAGNAVVLGSGGRIVVGGESDGNFAVAVLTGSGAPDSSFDGDGRQTADFGTAFDRATDVVIQASGRVVLTGQSSGDWALAGFTSAGAPDAGFGAGGQRTTDFGGFERANGAALMSDNRIIVVGDRDSDVFAVARYDANGTLDSSCDGDGKFEETFVPATFHQALSVVVQFNDRFVVGGTQSDDFALARYEPSNCALDTSFGGGDGKRLDDFGGGGNGYSALAIQASNGKIVGSGGTAGEPGDQIVVRFAGDEPPPPPPPEDPPPPPPPPPPEDPCANDKTGPQITVRSLQDKTLYQEDQSPASVRVEATDPSGLASDPSDASRSISTSSKGLFTVTVTARDNCNNLSTATFKYRVAGDPAIGIGGVRASCVASNFVATIRITADVSLRSVTARLNGKLLAKGTKSRLSFKVPAKRLRAGMHKIAIATRDRAGNRSTMTVNFARCVVVEPSFTG